MAVPHLHLIVGEFGTGKSFRLLEYGCELADRYHKCIVANFPINLVALRAYCRAKGYKWLESMIDFKRIFYIPSVEPQSMDQLLERPNSVVLLDEAGVFLNARSWASTPKGFLASLVQVRKDGIHFVVACHFLEQVDRQLRDNCQRIVECRAISIYDKALRRPKMLFRWWHEFGPKKYSFWLSNPQFQQNWFRTFFLCDRTFWRFVSQHRLVILPAAASGVPAWLAPFVSWRPALLPSADALLFKCFDSFHRLDKIRDRNPQFPMSPKPSASFTSPKWNGGATAQQGGNHETPVSP